jgi:hypothetical protein
VNWNSTTDLLLNTELIIALIVMIMGVVMAEINTDKTLAEETIAVVEEITVVGEATIAVVEEIIETTTIEISKRDFSNHFILN